VNAIQELLSGLENVSKCLTKDFKGFCSGFTELHAKLNADTLLDSAIHCRKNETQVKKALI
jgi:hypothetical protein